MKKRLLKKFQKEYKELVENYGRIMQNHTTRVYVNFINDVARLNKKYEELKKWKRKKK